MPIRKYGNEPAKIETRAEDNDSETLESVRKQAQDGVGKHRKPECDDEQADSQ